MKGSFIAILLFVSCNSLAQINTADSIKQVLDATTSPDTSRVLLLNKLAIIFQYANPDTTMLLAQQALSLARRIRFERGEGNSLTIVGNMFYLTGNYPKSLEAHLLALQIREKINDLRGVGVSYSNIASIYSEQSDQKQALMYSLKGRTIAETLHNDALLASIFIGIGDSYEKLNRLDSALLYTKKAYNLAIRLNSIEAKGITLGNLGNIYSKMGQPGLAMNYYRLSIPELIAESNDDTFSDVTLGMASLFRKAGNEDSARHYANQSLAAAKRSGFTKRMLDASIFLSTFYEGIGRIDSAYSYQKITLAAKDSLFSQEKTKEVQNLGFNEQIRQREIAEAKEKAAEERKVNIQMAGIGAFIPSFFGVILLIRKRKTKPKIIEFMGLLGLLLLFEFIALFIHPYIEIWTHHTPVLMLLILVAVASLLVPMHHKLEHWIKEKLVYKKIHPAVSPKEEARS